MVSTSPEPNPSSSPPPLAPHDAQPKESPQSFHFKILSITLFVLILTFAGLFLTKSLYVPKLSQQAVVPTPSLNEAPSVSPEPPVPSDTANWKTYTNKVYGFNLKYPNEWVYKEVLPNTSDNSYSWPPMSISFAPESIPPGIVWMTIDTSHLQLNEYIDSQLCHSPGDCASSRNATNIQVGGYPAKKVLDMPGPLSTENILVKKDDTIYRITISYQDKSYEELYSQNHKREIFDQILSTFKFIDKANEAMPPTLPLLPTPIPPIKGDCVQNLYLYENDNFSICYPYNPENPWSFYPQVVPYNLVESKPNNVVHFGHQVTVIPYATETPYYDTPSCYGEDCRVIKDMVIKKTVKVSNYPAIRETVCTLPTRDGCGETQQIITTVDYGGKYPFRLSMEPPLNYDLYILIEQSLKIKINP